jgi:hemerythrin-like domain-containing protein
MNEQAKEERMAVQIGAKPDSGFDDPLGMLKDCHRRIENFLRVLCQVAESDAGSPLNGEQRSAVESALHYFRVGGTRHTRDEEESLFPRLQDAAGAGALEPLGRLEHEHREADALHAEAERLFTEWMARGSLNAEEGQALRSATSRLKDLYAEHIWLEEEMVFPHAAEVLSREAIAAMGEEFCARRNQSSS